MYALDQFQKGLVLYESQNMFQWKTPWFYGVSVRDQPPTPALRPYSCVVLSRPQPAFMLVEVDYSIDLGLICWL